ncbi:MAG: hypothetical protein ABIN67_05185 [Ferruginibacter sp.]
MDKKSEVKFKAEIGQVRTWWNYYLHYKTALDFIVEGVENNLPINTISLPAAFLIRHSLELILKANILKLETVSSARKKLKLDTHNLKVLYKIFSDHLLFILNHKAIDAKLIERIKEGLIKTEKLKNILHELDEGSFNFRYPVDKENKNNFKEDKVIQVAEIVKAFYEVQDFLVFVDAALYEQGVFGFEDYVY